MASLAIHEAVARQYLKIHSINNIASFLEGNIAPDLVRPKSISHYTSNNANSTVAQVYCNKVDLSAFVKAVSLDTDYNLGIFLHLVTDYVFYNYLLINTRNFKIVKNLNIDLAKNILYLDYNKLNKFLFDKYHIDPLCLPETGRDIKEGKLQVFNKKEIVEFIELIANLNLVDIYQHIKQHNTNNINYFLNKNYKWL